MGLRRRSALPSPPRVAFAFVAALVAHVIAAWILSVSGALDPPKPRTLSSLAGRAAQDARTPAEERVEPLEIEQLVQELREPETESAEERRAEEEKKKEEEDPHANGQVVDLPPPAIEQRPDKANYLAEYDSKVERETRGRVGKDRAGGPEESGGEQVAMRAGQAGQRGSSSLRPGPPPARLQTAQPGQLGQRGERGDVTEEGVERRAGAPGEPGHLPSLSPGEGGLPLPRGPDRPTLVPSEEVLQRAITRGRGSPDWIDADDGESTALNAKKWKFTTFFNRVKTAVAQEWHPDVVYLRHDPSGNVYGVRDRVTLVRVHLHPDGRLASVDLVRSSGVDFLDDEALGSMRRAQPFPNPPPALIDADGKIHFNFGFIFELSGSTKFKVFRYQ